MDDAVRLHLLANCHHFPHDAVEAGVIGVDAQFLTEEVDAGAVNAVNFPNGVLHFCSAVGTVQVREMKTLFHKKQLLFDVGG